MSAIGGMALNVACNAANQAVSQWINYGFQKRLMGKQYQYNEMAAENAYERQLDFWTKQNQYDSPASQIRRLRAAGLNPGLINGQLGNTSNNLSSVSSSSVSTPPGGPAPGKLDVMQIMMQDESIKNLAADTAVKRENAEYQRMLNKQEAIRTNDFESYYQLLKDELTNRKNLTEAQEEYYRNQAKKSFEEARSAAVAANNAESAESAGVNPIIDSHKLTEAQIQHYMKQKEEIDARVRSLGVDTAAKQFALDLSKIYDEQFLKLNLSARETEVQEFLDTSDVRVSLYNVQKSFAKLAVDEAERQDALNQITNEYDKHIAQQILDATKDGSNSLDAVLLKYFTENPASTLSAIGSLASFSPNITNNNGAHYVTSTRHTVINN